MMKIFVVNYETNEVLFVSQGDSILYNKEDLIQFDNRLFQVIQRNICLERTPIVGTVDLKAPRKLNTEVYISVREVKPTEEKEPTCAS